MDKDPNFLMSDYKAAFDCSPIGKLIIDRNLVIKQVNKAFLHSIKSRRSSLIGQHFGDGVSCPNSHEGGCGKGVQCFGCNIREYTERVLETGKPSNNIVVRHITDIEGEQTELWYRLNLIPILIENENNVMLIVEDITEWQRVENALRDSEEKFRQIFHNSMDSILVQEIQPNGLPGKFIEVNDRACREWGYTREEFLQMNPDLLGKYQKIKNAEQLIDSYRREGHVTFESIIYTSDHTQRDIEINSHKITLNGRDVLLSIVRDVTERKKAETQVRENQKKFEQLFMNMFHGFAYCRVLYDENGNIFDFLLLDTNNAFIRMFGLKKEKVLNNKFFETFSHINEVVRSKLIQLAIKARDQGVRLDEYHSENTDRWYSLSLYSPEKDHIAVIITDISENIKAKEQLKLAKETAEAANRTKSEFLANMSHEIRTPLNGMLGMLALTLGTDLTLEQQENLEIAKNCANTLLNVINDILDFSKMEAGKLKIDSTAFDVKALIEDAVKVHTVRASEKKLEVSYQISTGIPGILIGDPARLRQVIDNLASNAIKFTYQGGINLSVKKKSYSGDTVELLFSVSDTGIGIAQNEMELLFKSFSQVDSSYTRRHGGTGLGLAISRQLVEMMGGTIWVESEKGKGSIFYFTMIFKTGDAGALINEPPYAGFRTAVDMKILIVEDDPVNQVVLARMLKEKGLDITVANNGIEALKVLETISFDLIFMDIQMPELDGIKATRALREGEGVNKRTPVIAVTAYALEGDREKFLSLGMDAYIAKPIQMEELYRVLDKYSRKAKETVILHSATIVQDNSGVALTAIHETLGGHVKELRRALENQNLVKIENEAGRIKALSSSLNAEGLKRAAFKIELAARREDLEEVIRMIPQIRLEYEKISKDIK